jgi:hypothetical protein
LARLPWLKALLASLQQTITHPRPARQSLPPTLLIFGMPCRTLGRPMGGDDSQKLLAPERNLLLSGRSKPPARCGIKGFISRAICSRGSPAPPAVLAGVRLGPSTLAGDDHGDDVSVSKTFLDVR